MVRSFRRKNIIITQVNTDIMLRVHYVPGGHGSPVCSKRSVPWNFGNIFLCFQDLLQEQRYIRWTHGLETGEYVNQTYNKNLMVLHVLH